MQQAESHPNPPADNARKVHPELRVASVQMECLPGDKAGNLAVIESFVRNIAEAQSADLIVFPECCITSYWFIRNLESDPLRALAERIPDGPSLQRVTQLANSFQIAIGVGLIEVSEDGCSFYNSYVVVLPDGSWHRHRKLHAFEHPLISSGNGYTVFELPSGWRAAILICYDCNLIENVRAVALLGADVLIAPHQTGGVRTSNPNLMGVIPRTLWDQRASDPQSIQAELLGEKGRAWLLRWLPSRAHDNGLFLIFSNGVGVDDDEIRTGNAMILDPYGRILVETSKAGADMVRATLSRKLLPQSTGRSWIRARRPELYSILSERMGNECDTRTLKFNE